MDLHFSNSRVNSNWISSLNVKSKAIQILEENTGELYNSEKGLLTMMQKSISHKGKIVQFDYIKKCMPKAPEAVPENIR